MQSSSSSSNLDLVQKFLPIYHFDSAEKFFPVDFNEYIKNAEKTDLTYAVNTYVREMEGRTWIYYWCFYTYDSGMYICHFDSHKIDFELCIVEIKNDKVNRVCFCPHGSEEHFWIAGNDINNITDKNNNRIHIYASNGKHASYPLPGRILRYYGFANDTNNDKKIMDNLTPIPLNAVSMQNPIFGGKTNDLTYDYDQVKTISLDKVKTRMFVVKCW